ncbi:MAG: Nif3-like dinuclear metal center hexameric protein, partial [Clostridia bacterium]|nr:Nif3-like dinuclear metal center hexameric protein [Clostridia bacterium]
MTVKELYVRLNERIPAELREPWDNDGIMCCADSSQEVHRVIVTLDVTEEVVDYAIDSHVDLIVSHHPLIFRPLYAVTEENHIGRKLIKLLENGIAVFSFHTRLDKVAGGVNDKLCQLLGIRDAVPF